MGSLTSGPKAPAPQTRVVYVPQPVNTVAAPASTPDTTNTETQEQETASEVRAQSLLGRERSRFGTVKTSFRGLLGLADNTQQRKTLLGE